jgi:hypothetical protein
MFMQKLSSILLILFVSILIVTNSASAQTAHTLELTLNRDFGYAGFNNDIQGLYSMKIKDPPANLEKVIFYIETTTMGEDTQPPFNLQFNTDSYSIGNHSLSAVGYTTDGNDLKSNIIQVQFVPAGSGMQSVVKIIVPIVLLIVFMGIIAVFLPILLSKGKIASTPPGTPRKYGIGGGAICPKCNRPFPLRLWWINLGTKKFDRCPYCGKWSFVHPSQLPDLRAAEAAELTNAHPETPIVGESEAEKLKKDLDDSRFQDM